MSREFAFVRFSMILFLSGLITSCVSHALPPESATPVPASVNQTPSPFPTSCTGWTCEISGVVSTGESQPSDVFTSQVVKLHQISWCSPTAGEQETQINPDGTFSFEIYLHDTDTLNLSVDIPGYLTEKAQIGGFDCLSCSCSPIELSITQE